MKISHRISLALIILLAFTIGALSFLGYNISKQSENHSAEIILARETQIMNSKISDWMLEKVAILNTISRNISQRNKTVDQIRNEELKVYKEGEGVLCIYVVSTENKVVDSENWVPDADDDVRTRDYYKGAVANDGPYFSEVYVDAQTKESIITISMPLKNNNGALMGVISLDVTLTDLFDFMNQQKVFGGSGTVFLTSEQQNILYTNDETAEVENLKDVELFKSVYETLINTPDTVMNGKYDKNNYAFFSQSVDQVGWKVVIAVPDKVMHRGTQKITKSFIMTAVVFLIIGIVFSMIISVNLKNKFAYIESYISEVANYKLSYVPDKDYTKRKDEVGVISRGIHTMTENLRELVSSISGLATDTAATAEELTATAQSTADAANEVEDAVRNISTGASSQAHDTEEAANDTQVNSSAISEMIEVLGELKQSVDDINIKKEEGKQALEGLSELSERSKKESTYVNQIIMETNESTEAISQASEMIQSIADQTNLLALNAAIDIAYSM